MISTITNQGKVRWMISDGTMNAQVFIVFLSQLIASVGKKVFLIVNPLSEDETVVDTWVAQHKEKVEIFYLPKDGCP